MDDNPLWEFQIAGEAGQLHSERSSGLMLASTTKKEKDGQFMDTAKVTAHSDIRWQWNLLQDVWGYRHQTRKLR